MGVIFAALLLLPAAADPGGEIALDRGARTVEVKGVGAPSLEAPSAAIGRVEAERKARADAGRRLRRALLALPVEKLGCAGADELPKIEEAITRGILSDIEWGSDGSVRLVLRVKLDDMIAEAPAGSVPPAAAHGEWFTTVGGDSCASARAVAKGSAK